MGLFLKFLLHLKKCDVIAIKESDACPGGIACPKCGICNPDGSERCGNCGQAL